MTFVLLTILVIKIIDIEKKLNNGSVVMEKPPPPLTHFLFHPMARSLSREWTQEVDFSMTTIEAWSRLHSLVPRVLFHTHTLGSSLLITTSKKLDL